MDSSQIILLLNFILQILQMMDHSIFAKLKSSKCFGAEIVLKDDKPNDKPDDAINKL